MLCILQVVIPLKREIHLYFSVECIYAISFLTFRERADSRPVLQSKGMHATFQKKGQKMFKKGKILAKMYKIWKCFSKRQVIACDLCVYLQLSHTINF